MMEASTAGYAVPTSMVTEAFDNTTWSNSTPAVSVGLDPHDADKTVITWDDATWILTSAFIIFTMQSGEVSSSFLRVIIKVFIFCC